MIAESTIGWRARRSTSRIPADRGQRRLLAFSMTLAAIVVSAASCASTSSSRDREIVVAAASDLRPAFEEVARTFTEETNTKVTFSFGSSGQLREQILNGAPFDVFASANTQFVDDVIDAGAAVRATKRTFARGRLALVTRSDSAAPAELRDLRDGRYRRIVIANPAHAPYGVAAVEALRSARIYDDVRDRLVYAENVADAFRIANSGNAEVGIVALSLALANSQQHTLLPDTLHAPIMQSIVVTAKAPRVEIARQFEDYVTSTAGQRVLARYGFTATNPRTP